MISGDLNHMIRPYVAPNLAHRRYREKFLWLNGVCYLLHAGEERILTYLKEKIADTEKERPPGEAYSLGVVTAGGNDWVQGIHISRGELHSKVSDFDGFLALVQRQTIISAHRTSVDFCFELLTDLLECKAIELDEKVRRKIEIRSLTPKELVKVYRDIDLPITETAEMQTQMHLLSIVRNLLEHRDGRIDADYIRVAQIPSIKIGDEIPIKSQQAGTALDLIDHVINTLNMRAVRKWPQLELRSVMVGARSGHRPSGRETPKPSAKKPIPKCQAVLLCEQIVQNSESHKHSLINIFENFTFASFPGMSITCYVYIELLFGEGDYEVHLTIQEQREGSGIVGTYPKVVSFSQATQPVVFTMAIPSLLMVREGVHVLSVFVDRQLIQQKSIRAIHLRS